MLASFGGAAGGEWEWEWEVCVVGSCVCYGVNSTAFFFLSNIYRAIVPIYMCVSSSMLSRH